MMRIDESIIFLKQRDDTLSTLQWGGVHHYNITYVYVTRMSIFFRGNGRRYRYHDA